MGGWAEFRAGLVPAVAAALLFFAVIASAALRPDVAAAGEPPVAAYSFDAGEGTVAEDLAGDHDGELHTVDWVRGRYGKALYYDGFNDYVEVPDSPELQLREEFTLEAWVRPQNLETHAVAISKEAGGFYSYKLYVNSREEAGVPEGFLGYEPWGWSDVEDEGQTLTPKTWNHLALTFDGARLRLYVNAELVDTEEADPGMASVGPLMFGGNDDEEFLIGRIDEVRIYDRALDAAEIAADRATPVQTPPSPPVAAYSFDAGEGAVAEDLAGEHDGTIEGATWFDKGRFGKALSFDGVNDCLGIEDAPDLQLREELTLAAWVKPRGTGEEEPILIKDDTSWFGYMLSHNRPEPNRLAGYIGEEGNVTRGTSNPATSPNDVWTHVALTFDGARIRLYVDGEEVDDSIAYGAQATTGDLWLGCTEAKNSFFKGLIDEVRIYDRALDEAEVQGTMSAGFPIAVTEPATDVGANGAILNGTANANSGETEYFFEYGPTKSYGSVVEGEDIGGRETVEVDEAVIDLEPETTYHYRLVAKGPAGIAYGKDQTMTTGKRQLTSGEEKEIKEAEAAMELTPSEKKAGPGNFYGMMWSGDLNEMRTMKVKEQNIYKAVERSGAKTFHLAAGPTQREVEEAEGKEPVTPPPAVDEIDEAFKIADKNGVTILPGLGGGPLPKKETALRKAWLAYAKKAVEKYGPESPLSHPAEAWVIWNEPNMPQFGGLENLTPEQKEDVDAGVNPEEFAVFFKEMAEALRSGSKKPITVLTPGLYGFRSVNCDKPNENECPLKPHRFLKRMDSKLGGSGAYDAIALHPYVFKIRAKYAVANNQSAEERFKTSSQRAPVDEGEVKQLSKAIKRSISTVHNVYPGKPLWITELGFPVGNGRNPRVVPPVSERIQKLLVKASFSMIQNNRKNLNIQRAFYYNIQDNPGPGRLGWEYRSGLLRANGSARPAWGPYSSLAGGFACPFAPC